MKPSFTIVKLQHSENGQTGVKLFIPPSKTLYKAEDFVVTCQSEDHTTVSEEFEGQINTNQIT